MANENFKFPNQFIDTQFLPYLERDQIAQLVDSLANSISKKYHQQELVILGVLKGGATITADLVRRIRGVDISIDFIKLSDLGRMSGHDGTIRIEKDIQINIKDKSVLIVEDIVDSGRALNFIRQRLQLSSPSSIEVLALFDKPLKRKVEVEVDYVGKSVQERFIIGYGLDLEGYGRNLEEVYYLKYPN